VAVLSEGGDGFIGIAGRRSNLCTTTAGADSFPILHTEVGQTAAVGEGQGDLNAAIHVAGFAGADCKFPGAAFAGNHADRVLISGGLNDLARHLRLGNESGSATAEVIAASALLFAIFPVWIDCDGIAVFIDEGDSAWNA